MKGPGKLVWKGKIAGGLFGVLAGPFGIFFGFLIGHLIDLILESAGIRRQVAVFLTDPGKSSLPGWEEGMYCFFCLGAAVFITGGGSVKNRRQELYDRLSEVYPLRDHDYKYLQEILEGLESFDIDPDLAAHALILHSRAGGRSPEDLFRGLAAYARQADGRTARGPAVLLRKIAEIWGIDPEAVGGIRTEQSGEEGPWEILGLRQGASMDEVKRVFRILASQFHPDGGAVLSVIQRRETEEAFKRIRNAYDECMRSFTRSAC